MLIRRFLSLACCCLLTLAATSAPRRAIADTMTWVPNADGSWHEPVNWSSNPVLPGGSDDVVINVGGATVRTITHSIGGTSIGSIQSQESLVVDNSTLYLNAGASAVNGVFTLSNGASLYIYGAGTTFAANGPSSIDGSNVYANDGGVVSLPGVMQYSSGEEPFVYRYLQASGAGSRLDLSNVTQLTGGGAYPIYPLQVYAYSGGQVDLSQAHLTAGSFVGFSASGAGSLIDLSAATNLDNSTVSISDNAQIIAPLVTSLENGSTSVSQATVDFSGITALNNSSVNASTDGMLDLSGVTQVTTLTASASGGQLDLSGLTQVTTLYASASGGGQLDLSQLAQLLPDGTVSFSASDAGSRIILPATTTVLDRAALTISSGGEISAPQLASLQKGTLTVGDATVSYAALTNIDGTSVYANAGAVVSLPGVTQYSSGEEIFVYRYLQASGAGSRLDLSNVTQLTGGGAYPIYPLQVYAYSGGQVDLSQAQLTAGSSVSFSASGAGSLIDLSAATNLDNSSVNISNEGQIIAPLVTSLENGSISVSQATVDFSSITALNNSSVTASTDGMLDLSGVTQVTTLTASASGGQLDLSGLTQVTTLYASASGGGQLDLSQLAQLMPGGTVSFSASDAGSRIILPATTTVLDRAALTISSGGEILAPQLASLQKGTLTVGDATVSYAALTNIDGTSVYANAGAVVSLPGVTQYSSGEEIFVYRYLQAAFAGSRLDLSNVTQLTGGGAHPIYPLQVYAYSGGQVDLSQAQLTAGSFVGFTANGAGSLIDLSAATNLDNSSVNISNEGQIIAPLVTSLENGSISVSQATVDFSSITALNNSNVTASTDGILDLSGVTQVMALNASASGGQLDLSGLTQVTTLYASASGGGQLDLSQLAQLLPGGTVSFYADGAGSRIVLPATTTVLDRATLTISSGGEISAPQLASLQKGSLTVGDATVSYAALTNIDGTSINANAGAVVSLPGVTQYSSGDEPFSYRNLQASGAGSRLVLSNVTTLQGGGAHPVYPLQIYAHNGGQVDLSQAQLTAGSRVDFNVTGAGSLIDLSAATNLDNATINIYNDAQILVPLVTSLENGSISVSQATADFSNITALNSSNVTASTGGILDLSGVTQVTTLSASASSGGQLDLSQLTQLLPGGTVSFSASDAGSRIILPVTTTVLDRATVSIYNDGQVVAPQLTSLKDGSLQVSSTAVNYPTLTNVDHSTLYAYAGAVVSLPGVTQYDAGDDYPWKSLQASGAGSRLDLSNLTALHGGGPYALQVYAHNGGLVDLSRLRRANGGTVNFDLFGEGSTLRIESLWVAAAHTSLYAQNSGRIEGLRDLMFFDTNPFYNGLSAATVAFSAPGLSRLEVGSADHGPGGTAVSNFGIGELVVGGPGAMAHVFLSDLIDNGNRGAGDAEALYLDGINGRDGLSIVENSTLFLGSDSGIKVFARIDGAMTDLESLFPPGATTVPFDGGFISRTLLGDFNLDHLVNNNDIDQLFDAISAGSMNPLYDVNFSGGIDRADVDDLVSIVLGSFYGDANLDKRVSRDDVVILTSKLGSSNAGWAGGDFNGDHLTSLADLDILSQRIGREFNGLQMPGPSPAAIGASAVPEPSTAALCLFFTLASALWAAKARRGSRRRAIGG